MLLLFLAVISVSGLYANTNFETAPYGDDFTFPTYSNSLFIESSDGCYADCGTSSCAGSGACVCSCSTFTCDCKPTVTPPPYGYNKAEINISINKEQYENLKELAHILYDAKDENARQAYLHLGSVIKTLKEKDAIGFHKEKDLYFNSLAKITNDVAKVRLNNFFEKVGVTDRV